uniref:Uncharacterized protein n=1 Tax=Avena sativa TaxID=4498 RepID=A0ACD5UZK7_AVESA
MADGAAKPEPEKKSWADVEEEEEAKAKAEAEAELAAAASSSSAAPTEPEVEAQAKQIEALSLSVPDDDGGGPEGPPLLDDSDDSQIQAVTSGDTVYESATTFEELNLTPELLKGLHDEMGFSRPSKIQAITLPMILTPPYKDLVAQAHNGSGKTTCFVLGMLSRVDPNRKTPKRRRQAPSQRRRAPLARQLSASIPSLPSLSRLDVDHRTSSAPPRRSSPPQVSPRLLPAPSRVRA